MGVTILWNVNTFFPEDERQARTSSIPRRSAHPKPDVELDAIIASAWKWHQKRYA